jgi:NADH:ubiquinone oxidoreductase subunit F (NADH-binding)
MVAGRLDAEAFGSRQQLVNELTRAMEMTSICGLGMVAAKPLESALALFPDDMKRHLRKA